MAQSVGFLPIRVFWGIKLGGGVVTMRPGGRTGYFRGSLSGCTGKALLNPFGFLERLVTPVRLQWFPGFQDEALFPTWRPPFLGDLLRKNPLKQQKTAPLRFCLLLSKQHYLAILTCFFIEFQYLFYNPIIPVFLFFVNGELCITFLLLKLTVNISKKPFFR